MLLLILGAMTVLALPLILATSTRLACSSASEFRARVLETIASAVHRGVAVEPQFLWLIAHDVRGRRRRAVRRAATALDEGQTLSVALRTALRLPVESVVVIAAAEGTSGLPAALREAASADRRRTDFRHQLLLRLAYPALVLSVLGGFVGYGIAPKFAEVCDSMDVDCSSFMASFEIAQVIGFGLAAVAVVVVLSGVPVLRSIFDRLGALRRVATQQRATAWLHALAGAVRAGRPLDVALERTADVIGERRHSEAVRAAAARVSDGESLDAIWTSLPLSAWFRARGPLVAGAPAMLAEAIEDLARAAGDHARLTRERALGILSPLLLTVTGATLGWIFLSFFLMLQRVRGTIAPW